MTMRLTRNLLKMRLSFSFTYVRDFQKLLLTVTYNIYLGLSTIANKKTMCNFTISIDL